jgi:hypothetical protein
MKKEKQKKKQQEQIFKHSSKKKRSRINTCFFLIMCRNNKLTREYIEREGERVKTI